MDVFRLVFLLIYTFGAVAFAAFFVLTVKGARTEVGPSSVGPTSKPDAGLVRKWSIVWSRWKTLDLLATVINLICTLWFLLNIGMTVQELHQGLEMSGMHVVLMTIAFAFPPLILHMAYENEKPFTGPSRFYSYLTAVVYALSFTLMLLCLGVGLGLVRIDPTTFSLVSLVSLFVLFTACGIIGGLLGRSSSRLRNSKRERKARLTNNVMLAATSLVFLAVLLAIRVSVPYGQVIGLGSRAIPLAFIFVGTYYRSRYEFFDIFVKQGVFFLGTLFLLTAFFALLPPIIEASRLGEAKPWVYAVLMLPLTLALPWAYRNLGAWLDRVWLGRQFVTVDAVKAFLSGVKNATSEEDLVAKAENCLSEIVSAPVEITMGESSHPVADEGSSPENLRRSCRRSIVDVEVPIRSEDAVVGWIGLGTRANDAPYFSEDIKLVSSLADVFFSVLANVRLQGRKQEQEKREQELILSASRSELKALRAQINPHFLFNALNAIAGLIERQPTKAEDTVERLAEVFRYTLRRSENEWVRLGDEMDFIQAYLEIEQARFGERLRISIEVTDEAAEVRIPAMVVQTLVENAIKHGVASIRGPGIVQVRAFLNKSQLVIEILDNGPGFERTGQVRETSSGRSSGGYGLRNVRERLEGYFEDDASLDLAREGEMTVVRIQMPTGPIAGAVVHD